MYRGASGNTMLRTQTVDIPAGYIAEAQSSSMAQAQQVQQR